MKLNESNIAWNSFTISLQYQVCLLAVIILAIYYPSMFAEVSLLDDREAISGMLNSESFDPKSIFFPRSADGGYYRPFIGLSYAIDRFLWFLDAKIMHFENIVIHLLNTIMVFWVGNKLCQNKHAKKTMLPLWGAMIFALHPVNTESVNWISGRTDPMACTFVLAALLLVISYRTKKRILLLVTALIMTLLGVLAKETALGFIPASIFILMATDNADKSSGQFIVGRPSALIIYVAYTSFAFLSALLFTNYYLVIMTGIAYWMHCQIVGNCGKSLSSAIARLKSVFLVVVSFVFLVVAFYGLRKAAFVSDISKISNTLHVMTADINYTIELFMGAAGLYAKKFFVPIPLNIAIREVDPLYELFGVVCFMVCIYFIYLRRVASALVIAGFLMLAPAFPFAFGTIAWTAYAERYDYIPSAFWILGCICFIQSLPADGITKVRTYGVIAGSILVLFFAWLTFERNLLWQTNISIFKDAVEKSPDFKNVRGIYISALFENKQYDEAERQYFIARNLHSIKYDERYDLLYASILLKSKKYDAAEKVFADIELKTNGKSVPLLEALIDYYEARLFDEKNVNVINAMRANKISALERLYELNKSPQTAYILGQAFIADGNWIKAQDCIKNAVEQFSAKDSMKHHAEVLLKSIENRNKK